MTAGDAATRSRASRDKASSAARAPRAPRRAAAPAQAAYVLHSYDWSESSLVVELLTRELGRVAVVAKGAKRPYSQLRAVLLPFQRLAVGFGRVAGSSDADAVPEIFNLRAAEWDAGGAGAAAPIGVLRGDALWSGFYLNELLLKLLARQDPHQRLFDAYAATLPLLASGDEGVSQAALRAFELLLLREIGVLPGLGEEAATLQPLQQDARYALRAEHGLVRAAAQSERVLPAAQSQHVLPAAPPQQVLPAAQWQALQAALDADAMAALRHACAQAGAPLRAALRQLLVYHLGTPLRTRQVLQDVQRLSSR